MSIHSSMMREGGAPSLMEALGDVEAVLITPASGSPFRARAIIGLVRGQSEFVDVGDETKVETASVKVLLADLVANGITSIPVTAKVEIAGHSGAWSIRVSECEWGSVWVKLGLEREILVRQFQGRRNAAV